MIPLAPSSIIYPIRSCPKRRVIHRYSSSSFSRSFLLHFKTPPKLCNRHTLLRQGGLRTPVNTGMGRPLESPEFRDAEALKVVEAADVVCGYLGDAVAVVGEGELAAQG